VKNRLYLVIVITESTDLLVYSELYVTSNPEEALGEAVDTARNIDSRAKIIFTQVKQVTKTKILETIEKLEFDMSEKNFVMSD